MGIIGEACLPSNAYYPRTPDCTLYSGVHACWSEYSDSSFVYGFMRLIYGLSAMTTTTFREKKFYVACHVELFFFLLLMYTRIIIYGFLKKSVMPLFIFWITFVSGMKLNFIGKLLVFR